MDDENKKHKRPRISVEFILLRVALRSEYGYWDCGMYQLEDHATLPHEKQKRGNDYDEESSWI